MEDKSAELALFEAIETRLQSLVDAGTIYSVETYNAQVENESEERARRYPYLTVEISTLWNGTESRNGVYNIAQVGQKGICTITTRLVFESLENETPAWKEYTALNHVIYRKINGLQDANLFTCLDRTETPHPEPHDNVIQILTVWNSELTEYSLTDDDLTALESGNWTIENQTDLDIDNDIIRTGDGQ